MKKERYNKKSLTPVDLATIHLLEEALNDSIDWAAIVWLSLKAIHERVQEHAYFLEDEESPDQLKEYREASKSLEKILKYKSF